MMAAPWLAVCAAGAVLLFFFRAKVSSPQSTTFTRGGGTSVSSASTSSNGGCPFGFGRELSTRVGGGREEQESQTFFLDTLPLEGCANGTCPNLNISRSLGGFFLVGPGGPDFSNNSRANVCEDQLPPPLVRLGATQAAAECLELASAGKCVEPQFVSGEYCALSCGVCRQPVWVDGVTGSYSGPDQLLDNGLFNPARFLPRLPRKLDCLVYDPAEVADAIKAWAATKPDNLDLPKLVRAGFHDAADFNKWTGTGGPNGNLVSGRETFYGQTHGFVPLVKSSLSQFKAQFGAALSWADLLQIASMVAVEIAGGPPFEEFGFEPGRVDALESDSLDGLLPNSGPKATIATNRDYWYRAGFDDRELVAAMGGHTLGGTQTPARDFTSTPDIFNNEYYSSLLAHESTAGNPPCCVATAGGGLAQLPTDRALLSDPATRSLVQLYAANQSLFFHDYARAVRKMSLFGRDSSVQWCLYPAATAAGAAGAGAGTGAGAGAGAAADATGASIAVAVAATDAAVPAISVSATAPQPQPQPKPQPPLL